MFNWFSCQWAGLGACIGATVFQTLPKCSGFRFFFVLFGVLFEWRVEDGGGSPPSLLGLSHAQQGSDAAFYSFYTVSIRSNALNYFT